MNIIKRLLSAVLALAGGLFSVHAAEVISINFTQNGYGTLDEGTVYDNLADPAITGAAWNTFSGGSGGGQATGGGTLANYWDGTQARHDGTAVVSYEARNMWNAGADQAYRVGYLDDGEHNGVWGPTVSVTGIPYGSYDVILYVNSDNVTAFKSFMVNGISYSAADGKTVKGSTENWGARQNALEEGKNVLRITGLMGALTIQGGQSGNVRGSLAAIQIVNAGGSLPTPTFSYDLVPGANASGWFTGTMNGGLGTRRMISPLGQDAYVTDGYPWQDATIPEDFTFASLVNVDYVTPGEGKYGIVWCLGKLNSNNRALVLAKNGADLCLVAVDRTGSGEKIVATVREENLAPGYHLVIATYSAKEGRITLKVDAADAKAVGVTLGTLAGGLQLGSGFGSNPDPFVVAPNAAIVRLLGWSGALTDDQQTEVWEQQREFVAYPLAPSYLSEYAQGGIILVPDLETAEQPLDVTKGTMRIGAGRTVSVPSISTLNSGDAAASVTMEIAGTVNVTAESDNVNVWSDRSNKKGMLFGH